MKIKIDEKTIRDLPQQQQGQRYYFDSKMNGFGLCVGKTSKTFFLQRTLQYKTKRIKIGSYPAINCAQARNLAMATAVKLQNPDFQDEQTSRKKLRKITLQNLYDQYIPTLKAQNKTASLTEYPQILNRHFSDWLNKPATAITRDMVADKHRKITLSAGASIANKSFRVLRALFNFAMIDHEGMTNPVKVLTDRKLWNKEQHCTNRLKSHQLEIWMSHLHRVPNPITRLYILFVLLHGLRKSEALSLQWSDIDFHHGSFIIRHTKNKKPLTLPMTPFAQLILDALYAAKTNEWVFPSMASTSGHFESPRKTIQFLNEKANTLITVHDLRRTFVSIANSLNLSHYTLKRLVNHSLKSDVTAIYISDDIEDLRNPLQTIQTHLFSMASISLESFLSF